MASIGWIVEASTLRGVGLAIALLISGKVIDALLQRIIGRKIFSPVVGYVVFKGRSLITRFDPIEAKFALNYTPRDDYTVGEVKSHLEEVLDKVNKDSKGRISSEDIRWNGSGGRVEVNHSEADYKYDVLITINEDRDDQLKNPQKSLEETTVQEIHFDIGFEFSYPDLDAEIPNIGTFASKLEKALDYRFTGVASDPKIEFTPIDSQLSLDEWIRQEDLDVTLKLKGKVEQDAAKTEVEFHTNHIEIHPPYYEVDADVIRYIRVLVRKYYLKNKSTGNLLNPGDSRVRK
ncbi:hypothetical protein ACLI4Z_10830 [Natrialbaceae archaeon A-arb3/5]